MNHAEAPKDNDEVLRMFRERDSLGADSSLFLRVTRQLTQEGKPLGEIVLLTAPVDDKRRMLFGAYTFTEKNRFVFWPAMPRKPYAFDGALAGKHPDHITVEFPSERVHLTGYKESGKADRTDEPWRSGKHDTGFRVLFIFLVQLDVLRDQDVLISRGFSFPTTDMDRRAREMANAILRQPWAVGFPESPEGKHYLCCAFLVAPTSMTTPPTSVFSNIQGDARIENWAIKRRVSGTHLEASA